MSCACYCWSLSHSQCLRSSHWYRRRTRTRSCCCQIGRRGTPAAAGGRPGMSVRLRRISAAASCAIVRASASLRVQISKIESISSLDCPVGCHRGTKCVVYRQEVKLCLAQPGLCPLISSLWPPPSHARNREDLVVARTASPSSWALANGRWLRCQSLPDLLSGNLRPAVSCAEQKRVDSRLQGRLNKRRGHPCKGS